MKDYYGELEFSSNGMWIMFAGCSCTLLFDDKERKIQKLWGLSDYKSRSVKQETKKHCRHISLQNISHCLTAVLFSALGSLLWNVSIVKSSMWSDIEAGKTVSFKETTTSYIVALSQAYQLH